MAVGAGAIASGIILLPSALKPKMAWWIWLTDGLGAVPCRNGQNCAPNPRPHNFADRKHKTKRGAPQSSKEAVEEARRARSRCGQGPAACGGRPWRLARAPSPRA